MKKKLIIFLGLILILSACQNFEDKEQREIFLKGKNIQAEVVVDSENWKKGLSNRESLCDNCGMLFVSKKTKKYNFWMKEMKFPLDIIYLKDGVVVEIFKNVPIKSGGEYTRINPTQEADFILELNAGWAESNNLQTGDQLEY